jgi:hypothetical protein
MSIDLACFNVKSFSVNELLLAYGAILAELPAAKLYAARTALGAITRRFFSAGRSDGRARTIPLPAMTLQTERASVIRSRVEG